MIEQSDSEKISHGSVPVDATESTTPVKVSANVGKGWRRFALILLIVLVGLAGAIVWYGLQFQQHLVGLQRGVVLGVEEDARNMEEISAIKLRLIEQQSARAEVGEALSASIVELKKGLESQAQNIAKLTVIDRDQLLFAELAYMARVANERLLTERKPAGALLILAAIDKLLLAHNGVGILTTREILAGDMAALRSVEVIDRVGLYARLGAQLPIVLSLSALPDDGFSGRPGLHQRGRRTRLDDTHRSRQSDSQRRHAGDDRRLY